VLAGLLSALAGMVDAIGYLHLGGLFISFMSGNRARNSPPLSARVVSLRPVPSPR